MVMAKFNPEKSVMVETLEDKLVKIYMEKRKTTCLID